MTFRFNILLNHYQSNSVKKQFLLTVFWVSLWFQTTQAQRVDLDRDYFYVSYVALPSNPLNVSFKSYSVLVKGYLAETGLTEKSLENDIVIPGFKKLPKDADLDIVVNIGTFRGGEPTVVSRIEERKDDKGKVISTTTYYAVEMRYDYPIEAQMTDYKGNRIFNETLAGNNQVYKSDEGLSSREVLDNFNRRYTSIRAETMRTSVQNQFRTFSDRIVSRHGYLVVNNSKELFWMLDSPKHPEYENHAKNIQEIKRIMTSMKAEVAITEQREAMKPVIEYFRTIPQTYNKDEKADRKIRYSALYALMKIYFWMEDFENAKFYADALIQNDYDGGDGKSMMKLIQFAEERFKINNTTTRHFFRDVENTTPRSDAPKTAAEPAPSLAESEIDRAKRFILGEWQVISVRFQKPVDLNKDGKASENAVDEYSACKRATTSVFDANNRVTFRNKNAACPPDKTELKYALRERDGKVFVALKDEFGDVTSYELLDISATLMKYKGDGGSPGGEAEFIYSKIK